MPIYEYLCVACGNVFELIKKVDQRNDCPLCESCGARTQIQLSKSAHTSAKLYIAPEGSAHTVPSKPMNNEYAAVRVEGENCKISLKDNVIKGFKTGISIGQKATVDMEGNRFIDVAHPLEIKTK